MRSSGPTSSAVRPATIVVLSITLAAHYVFVTTHHDQAPAERMNCAGNLKQIGLALELYAADSDGFLPPCLGGLTAGGYLTHPKVFLCPKASADKSTPPGAAEKFCTDYHYAYAPGMRWGGPEASSVPLVSDSVENHREKPGDVLLKKPGRFGNVLFADGHVKGFAGDEWYRRAGLPHAPERSK